MHDLKAVIEDTGRLAASLAGLYELPPAASARLLNYSENATLLIDSAVPELRQVLRINRPGYHSEQELEGEVRWLQAIMDTTPLIVAEPIRGRNGLFIQKIRLPDQEYNCMMFSFLDGEAPQEADEEELVAQFEPLGRITALLHDQVQQWSGSGEIGRFAWDCETLLGDRPRWGSWREAPEATPELVRLFAQASQVIRDRLSSFGKAPGRFGLIHADLRLANLLFDDDRIKVIDFDDCGFSWFLYDLGAALSFIEHKLCVPRLISSWLQGYRQVRALSDEEEAEIPTFIMLRRLVLQGWLTSHSDSDTAKEIGSDFLQQTAGLADRYLASFA